MNNTSGSKMNTQTNVEDSIFIQRLNYFRLAKLYRAFSGMIKRAFDFIVALFGLLLLSPMFMLVAFWIKRDTPGPVFYRGPRVGRNGNIFKMLKFRTMFENSESYSGPRLTVKGDARITPLGAWLRDTKINELPQLWNVLVGEMSLVGPRPEDPEIAKLWPEDALSKISSVRPGITSPASILYHDEERLLATKDGIKGFYESVLPEKIRLDLLYVRHHSFFSDLDTIFGTLFILVPRWAKLDSDMPETHFFAGPFARIGHRYFSWFLVDLVTSLAVIAGSAVLWRAQFPLNWGVQSIFFLGVILAFLFSGVNAIAGLNRIVWSSATTEDALGVILSSVCVTLLILGLNYLESIYRWLGPPRLPTFMIVVIGLLSGASFIFTRYRIRLLSIIANWWLSIRRNKMILGERLLVVGDGEAGRMATWLLNRPKYRTAFTVVGVINDNDPTQNGMRVNGYWMLGGSKDIPSIIKRHDVGVILSTSPLVARERTDYIFDLCRENNVKLIFLNDLITMVDQKVTKPIENYEYPAWLEERLAFKAMYDPITGLPNRYLFQDRIKHSLANAKVTKSHLAVMFIGIKREKFEADKLGRVFNDQILIDVAGRLAKCGKESDTLAYLGNNQFALVLEDISDESIPEAVAKRILGSFSEPVKMDQADVPIQVKIEIKISKDSDGYDEFETLWQTEIENRHFTRKTTEAIDRYDNAMGK
jgi:diguanylate cyclase (GGDEF)-like protein